MADEKGEGDPEGEKEEPEGEPEDKKDVGDLAELTKKLASMEEVIKKQQAVIDKFKEVGSESPPQKTEAERMEELESTIELFKKKFEADAEAKAKAEREKREAAVNVLIKEMPEFKDMRDTLMKVDESVLTMFVKKQAGNTQNPIMRAGAQPTDKNDWSKKIALAAERRKKHNETLQNLKY